MSAINFQALKGRQKSRQWIAEDPKIMGKIRQVLTPQEFTKVDGIIDLVFSTTADVKKEQELTEVNTPKNLSIGSTPASIPPRCSPLWFRSSRNHRFQDGVEMFPARGRIFLFMLARKFVQFVFRYSFFKVHSFVVPL